MQIGYDAKRYYHNNTGLGNYSRNVVKGMQKYFPGNEYKLYDEKPFDRSFRLGRMAKNNGCDVFHGLSNELPFDSCLTKGVRTIVTMHDVAWRTFPDMYHTIDRKIYDLKYGWAARHAQHVIAISESTRRDVQHFYGVPDDRISVLYQPVQSIFYNRMPKDMARNTVERIVPHMPKDFLLSVGSVNSRKNLLGTLKAMAEIAPETRLPLVVIGNGGDYMMECRNFALDHLRRMDVFWLSDLTNNHDLQAFYTCATGLLYPSHYEGFGLPVVEALLQGCPVMTSNTSSLPEAAGPGAILVDPKDTDSMTDGIKTLIDDRNTRNRLSVEGEAYCRWMFAPEKLTHQLMSIYKGETTPSSAEEQQ